MCVLLLPLQPSSSSIQLTLKMTALAGVDVVS